MKLSALVPPTLTGLFVKQLQGMILSGELKEGDKLPTERELGERMNVSRAVVNGGICRLADMGFLTVEPRKGVYVADYIRSGNIDVLEAIIEHNGRYCEPGVMETIFRFHSALEPQIVKEAAENATESGIAELEQVVAELRACGDRSRCAELVYEFFHTAAVVSGSMVWPLLIRTMRSAYISSMRLLFAGGRHDEICGNSQRLLGLIREGRVEESKDLCLSAVEEYCRWVTAAERASGGEKG